jgi:undecaprenyl diphosphate synthase
MLKKIQEWRGKETSKSSFSKEELMQHQIPEHIAVIMDGNGRWAKKRALPRVAGHHEGMKTVRKITKSANSLGVKVLTMYAFSTENWKRPKLEVDFLMKLPEEFLGTFLPELMEENVQVRLMGNKSDLPAHTLRAVENAMEKTKDNTGLILNFALNYGGRDEILRAVKNAVTDIQDNKLTMEQLSEEVFSTYLFSNQLPDPDFTDVLWPDFDENHLFEAISSYQQRGRRFGGI